jgi:hypothetical protein
LTRKHRLLGILLGTLVITLSGCATSGGGWDVGIGGGIGGSGGGGHVGAGSRRPPGPPDHAPAHGYRKTHGLDNVELVYDSGLNMYIVEGHANIYFRDAYYYRDLEDRWEYSSRIRGPWNRMDSRKLPHGLKKLHKQRERDHKKRGKMKGKNKRGERDDHYRGSRAHP